MCIAEYSKLLAPFVLASVLFGCKHRVTPPDPLLNEPAEPPVASALSPSDREAREIFSIRCTPCHGAQGHGDGVAAAALTPRPRNFADPGWQQTDANIEQIIREGGTAVGKSALMPANPDLTTRSDVVASLRVYIRSFASR